MSIQRWSPTVRDDDGPDMYMDDNGSYVYYDDHVAELQRERKYQFLENSLDLYEGGVEAMRATCIWKVENGPIYGCTPSGEALVELRVVLAALREVQP